MDEAEALFISMGMFHTISINPEPSLEYNKSS